MTVPPNIPPDLDLSTLPADEGLALVRQIVADASREAMSSNTPTAPTESAAQEPPAEPATPLEQGKVALREEAERAEQVAAAKALLRKQGREAGYPLTADGLDDDEALRLAGLTPREETPEQRRIRTENEIAAEGGPRLAALERQKAVTRLDQEWWSLHPHDRQKRCAELDVDYATAKSNKDAQMKKGDTI
jgi:hypothetical protein